MGFGGALLLAAALAGALTFRRSTTWAIVLTVP
jgi:hypothetical protein